MVKNIIKLNSKLRIITFLGFKECHFTATRLKMRPASCLPERPRWTARRNFGDCFWTRDTPRRIVEKNVINDISQIRLFKPRVKVKDLAVFCRQFSIVLEAGVPIANALDVLREQTTNRTLRECLDDVYDNIQKGIALSNAMRQHPRIFGDAD